MLKKYFLYNPFSSQKLKFLLVVIFLLSFKYFVLLLLGIILYALLHKKQKFDRSSLESLQDGILYAPFNGEVIRKNSTETEHRLELRLPAFNSFGVQMPIKSIIDSYQLNSRKSKFKNITFYDSELVATSELGHIKITFKCLIPFLKPQIWCRTGDVVLPGAYIGYLPFGGKVDIQFSRESDILVETGSKLLRIQTLLCSKGLKNG